VTLKRLPRPVNDLFRSYKVFISNTFAGTIRRGRTKSFDVAPGHHEIHLEIDWCRSRDLPLDLGPGEEVKLICKARPIAGCRTAPGALVGRVAPFQIGIHALWISAKGAVDNDLVQSALEEGELLIIEPGDEQLGDPARVDGRGLG
jgi:hypothetical protein